MSLKSNLELHLDVLHTLARQGPTYTNKIEATTNIDGFTLKKHLDFLVQNNLIEKRLASKKVLYIVTERGQKILDLFLKIATVLNLDDQYPHKVRC